MDSIFCLVGHVRIMAGREGAAINATHPPPNLLTRMSLDPVYKVILF